MTGRNPKFEWQDSFARAGYRGASLAVGTWIGNRWNGDSVHPLAPVDLLMKELGYSRRSVTLALRTLRTDGWIAQITRGGRRGETAWSSRYRLTIPNVQSVTPNVQTTAPQRATDCTSVDLVVDQTGLDHNPRFSVEPSSRGIAPEDQERARLKWIGCPAYPLDLPYERRPAVCSQCEVNDACAVGVARYLSRIERDG